VKKLTSNGFGQASISRLTSATPKSGKVVNSLIYGCTMAETCHGFSALIREASGFMDSIITFSILERISKSFTRQSGTGEG